MEKELIKNNVWYFEAGYKSGLVESGKYTKKEVEDLFYKTVEYPNNMRDALNNLDD